MQRGCCRSNYGKATYDNSKPADLPKTTILLDNGYHVILTFAINLLCTIEGIAINGFDNCTYRKTEIRECQADLSYYTGERARLAPVGKSLVNLDE